MLNKELEKEITEQIKLELESAYLYLSMASQCEAWGYKGFANWFYVQFQEENIHGMGLYKYLIDKGHHPELQAIVKPRYEWKNMLDVFKDSLEHEQMVTARFDFMAEIAIKVKDHATKLRLDWYITEQVEEEATFQDVITRLEIIGDYKPALLALDTELGARVMTTALPVPVVLPAAQI